jgi:hypothetical protein
MTCVLGTWVERSVTGDVLVKSHVGVSEASGEVVL